MGKTTTSGNVKWTAGLILVIVMAVIGWIWNAAVVCQKVEHNAIEDARVHPIAEQNHDDIIEMKRDITYIRSGVDEIKAELKK